MSKIESEKEEGRGYVQLFVYRIPKKNRDPMRRLLKEIADMLRRHGTIRSEFFQLYSTEAFQGFTSIAKTFSAVPDEELWVDLDHYKERGHRDQVMADIGEDTSGGALFRQIRGLVSEGYGIVMGEFDGMSM